jgi:hypothetical protein
MCALHKPPFEGGGAQRRGMFPASSVRIFAGERVVRFLAGCASEVPLRKKGDRHVSLLSSLACISPPFAALSLALRPRLLCRRFQIQHEIVLESMQHNEKSLWSAAHGFRIHPQYTFSLCPVVVVPSEPGEPDKGQCGT